MGCTSAKKRSKPEEIKVVVKQSLKSPENTEVRNYYTIGNYKVLERIGRVPYGSIHKCIHIPTSLPRTIKIIDIRASEQVSINPKHSESELKSLKSLDHPNILKIYDMFFLKHKFYVVMEPCEGGRLIDALTELKDLNENLIGKIFFQVLLAISYCHSKYIIHRDLNPKNIFLINLNEPQIKISEFGSSAFMDPENKISCKSHSKAYIAPEVFENFYNEKCDL